jgi:hypothetical protein
MPPGKSSPVSDLFVLSVNWTGSRVELLGTREVERSTPDT